MRQNVGLDGGDGDGPQNNTSQLFFKNGQEVKILPTSAFAMYNGV